MILDAARNVKQTPHPSSAESFLVAPYANALAFLHSQSSLCRVTRHPLRFFNRLFLSDWAYTVMANQGSHYSTLTKVAEGDTCCICDDHLQETEHNVVGVCSHASHFKCIAPYFDGVNSLGTLICPADGCASLTSSHRNLDVWSEFKAPTHRLATSACSTEQVSS